MEYSYKYDVENGYIIIAEYNSAELYSEVNKFHFSGFDRSSIANSFRMMSEKVSNDCLRYLIRKTEILDDLNRFMVK